MKIGGEQQTKEQHRGLAKRAPGFRYRRSSKLLFSRPLAAMLCCDLGIERHH
jgi:hypothetical protein